MIAEDLPFYRDSQFVRSAACILQVEKPVGKIKYGKEYLFHKGEGG